MSQAAYYQGCLRVATKEPYRLRDQNDYLIRHGICNSSVLIRSNALRGIPFAFNQLYQFEDWACWTLLAARGKFLFLDQPLVGYRVHPLSASAVMLGSKKRLRHLFALIEFKMAVLARIESSYQGFRVLLSLSNTFRDLLIEYLWSFSSDAMPSVSIRGNGLVKVITASGRLLRMFHRVRH